MDKKELVKLLFENYYCKQLNTIDLSCLDFSEYNCSVNMNHMVVSNTLYLAEITTGGFYHSEASSLADEYDEDEAEINRIINN